MKPVSSLLAIVALFGLAACNVDNDGDGIAAHLDCDDNNAAIYPGAPELCDGLDNDCDGIVDNNTTDAPTFYRDFDGDGFGDPESVISDCRFDDVSGTPDPTFIPFGYVSNDADCDDRRAAVNPDADEICDGIDNDCDGDIDGDNAVDKATWYRDADNDTFGDPDTTALACDVPTGFVGNALDCDDTQGSINPDADERCDAVDRNCDGDFYAGAVDAPTWYRDSDGDGYGDDLRPLVQCLQPAGHVADKTDCNDEIARVNPGATETCDGFDTDCNPATSEAGTISLNFGGSFSSVASAVAAASAGDLINVCAGTWDVSGISIDKPLSLVGPNGSKRTTLRGNGGRTILEISNYADSSGTVNVGGFTLTGGSSFAGGGLYADTAAVELHDLVVTGNSGFIGGGMYFYDAIVSFDSVTVTDNEAVYGGGLYAEYADLLLDGAIFNDNVADYGGGAYLYEVETLAEDSRFAANYTSWYGGGALAYFSIVDGGSFVNNLSTYSAGGLAMYNSEAYDIEASNNKAGQYGGGLGLQSECYVEGAEIAGNWAPWGGGVAIDFGSSFLVESAITGNEASRTGGGIYSQADAVLIDASDVTGNEAQAGGGVHLVRGSLEVSSSNFGAAESEDDNTPDDVFADRSGRSFTFGDAVSFFCSTSGLCE
jgi:hypothetical protein